VLADLVITLLNRTKPGQGQVKTLGMFADGFSGALEGFLSAIYYRDRASAERALDRVTQMIRASFRVLDTVG
jgi:hypothetical protein